MGSGAAITAGSVAFFFINRSSLSDASDTLREVEANSVRNSGRTCDQAAPKESQGVCLGRFDDATANKKKYQTRQTISLVGSGVGLVALGTGIVLLATGDDVHKYDREPASAKAKWITPVAYAAAGGGYFGVAGAF